MAIDLKKLLSRVNPALRGSGREAEEHSRHIANAAITLAIERSFDLETSPTITVLFLHELCKQTIDANKKENMERIHRGVTNLLHEEVSAHDVEQFYDDYLKEARKRVSQQTRPYKHGSD